MLRLHCDNVGNTTKRGFSVYMPKNSEYALAVASPDVYKTYGQAMLDAMMQSTGIMSGAVHQNDSYVGNNWAKMPCFLIEMGYMSTAADDLLLSEPWYQQLLCEGIAEGCYQVALMRGIVQ